MASDVLITMRGVSKSFGALRALECLDLSVSRGEIVGILGANGAGKSTAMRLAVGYLACDRGTIRLAGYDVMKDALAARRRLGYLPEGMPLWGEMRVGAFLSNVAALRGLDKASRGAAVERVVKSLSLEEVFERVIDRLSKGYRRRVGLAQALLHDPDVLILDEPSDGLDPNQKHVLRRMVRGLSKSKRKGILLSTHALDEVEALCDRAVILHRGRIVAGGTPKDLVRNAPKRTYKGEGTVAEGTALERAFRAYTTGS